MSKQKIISGLEKLNTAITYLPPDERNFDAEKLNRFLLDEPPMWPTSTPDEIQKAKIAYEKFKSGGGIVNRLHSDKSLHFIFNTKNKPDAK